jgi:two-component system response regulator YesN
MQIELSRILDRIIQQFPERRSLNMEIEVEIDRIFSQAFSYEDLQEEFFSVLSHVIEVVRKQEMASEIQFSYGKIKQYINAHLADELTVPQLCEQFFISASYLNKLFRRYDRQSVVEYIRKQRIDRSISLMRDSPDIPLKEIARMVGYEDHCYFSRIFKQEKGVSPRKHLSLKMTNFSN